MSDTTQTPIFLGEPPDWSQSIQETVEFANDITITRQGFEQRHMKRAKGRDGLSFQISGLGLSDTVRRQYRASFELRTPVIMPCWTRRTAATGISGATVTVSSAVDMVKSNYVALMDDEAVIGYWPITGITGNALTLGTGSTAIPSFFSGLYAYPCILGMKQDNKFSMTIHGLHGDAELVNVTEL